MIGFVVLLLLVAAGLEWNRRRQTVPPGRAGGREPVPDRDRERLLDDLRSAADRSCRTW